LEVIVIEIIHIIATFFNVFVTPLSMAIGLIQILSNNNPKKGVVSILVGVLIYVVSEIVI